MAHGIPEPTPLGPWGRGLNNVKDETTLNRDELRDACNVDINDAGNVRRRPGFTKVFEGVDTHSLWEGDRYSLVVNDGWLCEWLSDETVRPVWQLTDRLGPVSYAEVNGEVYWSNGTDQGRLVGSTPQPRPFALPTPDAPRLSATTGSLTPGVYRVTAVFVAPDGVESGAAPVATLTLASGEGLSIDAVPQPPGGYSADTWLYLTPPDGELFFFAARVPQGVTSWSFASQPEQDVELRTMRMQPIPPSPIVRHHAGSIYVALGPMLVFSEPLRFGLYVPDDDYLLFPADISVIEPVEGGLYVVADRTYYLDARDPGDMKQTVVYPYGAVPGSGMQARGEWFQLREPLPTRVAYWYSTRGGVVAAPGGKIIPLMEARAEGGSAERGTSYFVERDGIRQIGTVLSNPGKTSGLMALDSATAVIRRNGVVVG